MFSPESLASVERGVDKLLKEAVAKNIGKDDVQRMAERHMAQACMRISDAQSLNSVLSFMAATIAILTYKITTNEATTRKISSQNPTT